MLIKRSKLEIGKNFGLFWIIFQFIFTNDTKNLLLLPISHSWNILSKQLIQRQYQIASKLFFFFSRDPRTGVVDSYVTYFQTSICLHDQIEKTRISFCGGDWIFFQPLDGDFTHSNIILWINFHTCTFKLHLRSVLFRTVSSTRLVFIIDLSYFCDLIGSDAWWR